MDGFITKQNLRFSLLTFPKLLIFVSTLLVFFVSHVTFFQQYISIIGKDLNETQSEKHTCFKKWKQFYIQTKSFP